MENNHFIVRLKNRKLLFVEGLEAETFLHNLITTDVNAIKPHTLYPGALLTPQGKVMFDFLIGRTQNGFLIDIDAQQAQAFMKRLSLYKLRAKVEIVESDESVTVVSYGKDSTTSQNDSTYDDVRFPPLLHVQRHYNKPIKNFANMDDDIEKWSHLRITYGIAESGTDFTLNDVFPHDIAYDQIGGLSFKKGCYIGQEVVSRMHHRGTARRRPVIVEASENLAPSTNTLEAEQKPVGIIGTTFEKQGLALARLDRAKAAMVKGQNITVDGKEVSLSIPPNMAYDFPDNEPDNLNEDN